MVTAQRSFVGGVNHPHAAGTRGIEETAQIRDDAGAVSGQCRQNGIGAKYAVLAFHTNDGDGGGIETFWRLRHSPIITPNPIYDWIIRSPWGWGIRSNNSTMRPTAISV